MAVQQIRWGAISSTLGGSFTLSPGIDASLATVNIGTFSASLPKGATLTISDGTNTLTFPDCRGDECGMQWDASSASYFVRVRDRRWRWPKLGGISGEYNRRDATGQIIDDVGKKSAQQLAALLLDAMGETGYSVTGLPATDYPYVNWSVDTPALKLAELCERYSVLIWLWTDNKVYLVQKGTGSGPNAAWNRESHQRTEAVIDKPEWMILKGAPNLYQITLKLKAVALETDGTIVDFDDCTYTPTGGWTPGSFYNLTDTEEREAAEKSIFKWYRIDDTDGDSGWYDGKIVIGDPAGYTLSEILRRWSAKLVATADVNDDGEEKRLVPYIIGKHAGKNLFVDPNSVSASDERVKTSFAFDARLGVVKFSAAVFDYDENNADIVPAELYLTCAFAGDIFQYSKEEISGGVEDLGPEIIERTDLRYEYIDGTCQNQIDADGRAEAYIANELLKYQTFTDSGVEQGIVNSYSGIKDPGVSGAIEQITWQISNSTVPLTTIGWGAEHKRTEPPRAIREANLNLGVTLMEARAERATDSPDDSAIEAPDREDWGDSADID